MSNFSTVSLFEFVKFKRFLNNFLKGYDEVYTERCKEQLVKLPYINIQKFIKSVIS